MRISPPLALLLPALVLALEVMAPAQHRMTPELLFDGPYQPDLTGHPSYDVTADGQRFVMIRREPPAFSQISIILNWSERVKQLVPGGS